MSFSQEFTQQLLDRHSFWNKKLIFPIFLELLNEVHFNSADLSSKSRSPSKVVGMFTSNCVKEYTTMIHKITLDEQFIGRSLYNKSTIDIDATLVHEMIHQLMFQQGRTNEEHGLNWRKAMEKVGLIPKTSSTGRNKKRAGYTQTIDPNGKFAQLWNSQSQEWKYEWPEFNYNESIQPTQKRTSPKCKCPICGYSFYFHSQQDWFRTCMGGGNSVNDFHYPVILLRNGTSKQLSGLKG